MSALVTAFARLQGSCPVCGDRVPRTAAHSDGGLVETYRCPVHGPIEYGPRTLSLLSGPLALSIPSAGVAAALVWDV